MLRNRAYVAAVLDRERCTAFLIGPGGKVIDSVVDEQNGSFEPAVLMARLFERWHAATSRLHCVLMPAFAPVRELSIAGLARGDVINLAACYPDRYFPGQDGPVICAGIGLSAEGRKLPQRLLIACASEDLVRNIRNAGSQAGWERITVSAAGLAWALGLSRLQGVRRCDGWMRVSSLRHDCLYRLSRGRVVEYRRALPGCPTTSRSAEEAVIDERQDPRSPEHLAACCGASASTAELVPHEVSEERQHRARVTIRRNTIASTCVGLAILFMIHAGNVREIRAYRAARTSLGVQISAARDSVLAVEDANAFADVVHEIQHTDIAWSEVLESLAEYLPADARLESFQVAGDTAIISGYAQRGAAVPAALRRDKGLGKVDLIGPLIRERDAASAETKERFVIRLRPAGPG